MMDEARGTAGIDEIHGCPVDGDRIGGGEDAYVRHNGGIGKGIAVAGGGNLGEEIDEQATVFLAFYGAPPCTRPSFP